MQKAYRLSRVDRLAGGLCYPWAQLLVIAAGPSATCTRVISNSMLSANSDNAVLFAVGCRRFFEALYSALAAVLDEAFDRVGKHVAIEQELGRLFR